MRQSSILPIPPTQEEPEELARFRADWRAEVERRTRLAAANAPQSNGQETSGGSGNGSEGSKGGKVTRPATRTTTGAHGSISFSSASNGQQWVHSAHSNGIITSDAVSPTLGNALARYRQAIHHEQRGELDDALSMYRQAFRLDPHVDRAYHREEMLAAKLKSNPQTKPLTAVVAASSDIHQLASNLQQNFSLKASMDDKHASVSSDTLENIVKAFPYGLQFEPENELEPVLLNSLPVEMLLMILRKLDVTSLERFAKVNRKARVLTLDSVYWREAVSSTYKPPQIQDEEEMVAVVQRCNSDFRRVFIEHPRVRLDGVYIAICHYVRPGLSENSWVSISHLITYHRYLRFFPNGQVLSLLANEEHGPQQVIPILKPTLRMKGLSIGTWGLSGSTVNIVDLTDASGKFALPIVDDAALLSLAPSSTSHKATTQASSSTELPAVRYVFDMSLNLRSRPLGRWNRLDMISYDSVNKETSDVSPVALKNERPFWFSKVKSYA